MEGYNTTLESMSSSADLYRCTEARLTCYRASLAIAGGCAVHTIGEQGSNALQKARSGVLPPAAAAGLMYLGTFCVPVK